MNTWTADPKPSNEYGGPIVPRKGVTLGRLFAAALTIAFACVVASLLASTLVIPNKTYSFGQVLPSSQFNANMVAIEGTVNGLLDNTNLANGGINGSLKLDDGTVPSSKITDDTIAAVDIATGGVATLEILDATILTGDISTGGVTGANILDATVAEVDLDVTGAPVNYGVMQYDLATAKMKWITCSQQTFVFAGGIAGVPSDNDEHWYFPGTSLEYGPCSGFTSCSFGSQTQQMRFRQMLVASDSCTTAGATITLMRSGTATSLSCSVGSGTFQTCSSVVDVDFTIGQKIAVMILPAVAANCDYFTISLCSDIK